MALRTILPQDFYVEMAIDGDLIGAYVVMHDCDGKGQCGVALHLERGADTNDGQETFFIKCEECNEIGKVQQ